MSQISDLLKHIAAIAMSNAVCIKTDVLTVDGTVKNLPNIPTEANYAVITCESSNTTTAFARCSQSQGYTPSAVNGVPLVDGQKFDILGRDSVSNFKIIQTDAGTHKIWVEYFKKI